MAVIEAASFGTPSIVVAGEDNAATELIEPGVNGFIAPSAAAGDLADAITRVAGAGPAMRESTARWFAENAERLSIDGSLSIVEAAYDSGR
jgi:glycosyltransferase involved in cell wall biosynthesis